MTIKNIFRYKAELFAVAIVVLFFGLEAPNVGALFNSDALYLPVLISDLLNGGRLSDWYLTPSPYLFPDFIIFYLIYLAGADGYWSIVTFTIVQVLSYSFLLRIIINLLDVNNALRVHFISMFLTLFFAVIAGKAFQYIFIGAHHFSVVMISILILCLVLRSISLNAASATLLMIISFFMGLSDSLFIVQFTIPLMAAAVFVYWTYGVPRYLIIASMLLLCSALGYVSYSTIITHPMRYNAEIGLLKFEKLFQDYSSLSKIDRANLIALTLFGISGIVAMVRIGALKKWFEEMPINRGFIIAFACFQAMVNSLVVALTGNLDASDRYFIPIAVLITVSLAFCITQLKRSIFRLLIGCFILVLTLKFVMLFEKNDFAFDYEGNKVKCINSAIDEFSLKSGISEYWDAKKYQFLTGDKIELVQFTYDGNPYYWITSSKFFDKPHTFVMISDDSIAPNRINYEELIHLNGLPSNSRRCANTTLYIYDKPIKFRS